MLKAEQIPDDLARIADEAYYDTAGDNPTMSDEDIMKHAIAAAINAWPGMKLEHLSNWVMDGPDLPYVEEVASIILPLPQEKQND